MAQQTAVEWLIRNVNENIPPMYIPKQVVEQAKEMEKEQIMKAFENGIVAYDNPDRINDDIDFDAENYYNEIYEKDSTHN